MDNFFSAAEKGWTVLNEILDRMEKLEFSNEARKRIIENIQFMLSMLQKIKRHVKNTDDIKHLEQFYLHLQSAKESCDQITRKNDMLKFLKAPEILMQLIDIEKELKAASSKLGLFMETLNLTVADEIHHDLRKQMAKLCILQENPDCGIYYHVENSLKLPSPPTLSVAENKNRFLLSWKPCSRIVDEYEICYDEDECSTKRVKGDCTYVEIGAPWVEPGKIYTIKVRGIHEGIKGKWSNSVIAQFNKPLPGKPDAPQVTITSPTTATVTVKPPQRRQKSESLVTKWKVEYATNYDKAWSECFFEIDNTKKLDHYYLGLTTLRPAQSYSFRVSAMNVEGWSEASLPVSNNTKKVKPAQPENFRMSSYRTHSILKIRWQPPKYYPEYVTNYEVRKKQKNSVYEEPINVPGKKFSYTFKNLKQRTEYSFQVRACNTACSDYEVSKWNPEVTANTRIHKGIKAAFSPLVWVAATAGSPVLSTMGLGVAAGMAANESKGKVAAVAAGTAGTVGGAAIGTIAAPLIGAGMTHMFVHGMDVVSDQSDDES